MHLIILLMVLCIPLTFCFNKYVLHNLPPSSNIPGLWWIRGYSEYILSAHIWITPKTPPFPKIFAIYHSRKSLFPNSFLLICKHFQFPHFPQGYNISLQNPFFRNPFLISYSTLTHSPHKGAHSHFFFNMSNPLFPTRMQHFTPNSPN